MHRRPDERDRWTLRQAFCFAHMTIEVACRPLSVYLDEPVDFLKMDIEGAELVYLAPEIDPASRTAAVVYAIDNHDLHLRVGQSLGLALDTRTVLDGLLVPSSALIDEHGRPVVFVPLDGERFVRRHVTVGGHDATHSLITSGLDDGDRVVTRAAWAVKLAGAGTAVPGHGHTH